VNSLQAGLIGVSVLVIALFAAWLWWQSWRSSREQQRRAEERRLAFERERAARSKSAERTDPARAQWTAPVSQPEPTLDTHDSVSHVGNNTAFVNTRIGEPPLDETDASNRDEEIARVDEPTNVPPRPVATDPPTLKAAAVSTTLPLDDRLHVYAELSSRDGQAIDCQDFASLGDRTLAWGRVFRLSAWEAIEDPTSGGAVQALCLGLPIASRTGPLSDQDALAWKRAVSNIANNRLQLDVKFGGDLGVGERAIELDQFLAAADVICVLYLVRKDSGAWSGTRLRGTLEANGFRLQADGRFVYFEVESETPIFSAVDGFERSFTPERLRTENVNALRLVFEAANVANPIARFDVYRQTLRALARLLESDIKDGGGTNVGDAEFAAMREEVVAGSQALAEAGIECGSPTARSLFR
jgi:hypothetical protein